MSVCLFLLGWGKNGPAQFFSTQITICTRLMLLSFQGGEWADQVFPHPLKSNGCVHIHDRVRLMLSLVRLGKKWACPVFLHPDNHLHNKVDAISCQGGERMGQPSFSPPSKKPRLYAYSWQGMADAFTFPGEERMAGPVFLHPDNHLHKVDALSCQSGERMGWPSFSPIP